LKKENDEKRLKTHPAPSLKISNNPINRGKKEKKTRRPTSNKTSLVYHYSKMKFHETVNY
jgi:hypothetical protein